MLCLEHYWAKGVHQCLIYCFSHSPCPCPKDQARVLAMCDK